MKGVITRIAPEARIIDITHGLATGDIRGGAFALAAACRYFPWQSVHVVVVDPGVGSGRAAIAAQTEHFQFIAPDNGVLSLALMQENIQALRQITNSDLFVHPVSQTFHGRDVFTPVAAYLAHGGDFAQVGPEIPRIQQIEWPQPKKAPGLIQGEVVYIDRFGNAVTNIPESWVPHADESRIFLTAGQKKAVGLKSFYNAIPNGQMAGILGSSGYLEIAMNEDSAASHFGLSLGKKVTLHFTRPPRTTA